MYKFLSKVLGSFAPKTVYIPISFSTEKTTDRMCPTKPKQKKIEKELEWNVYAN